MGYLELDVIQSRVPELALGIDLGTTNSLGAIWSDGRPIVLHPEGRSGSVPSVVYVDEQGDLHVGREARERAAFDPENALFSIKRFMGRRPSEIPADVASVPCTVREREDGVAEFELRGRRFTPQELSARILMRVHDLACQALDANVTRAVITVPAYFDEAQRQATRDAARIAGIDVLRIVNEPTAASLAYGLDRRGEGTVAVYDLGGGTFDVSILTIEEGVFRVLSTSGDTHLGGDDLDRTLVALALAELEGVVEPAVHADRAFHQLLRLAAEKCKIELSIHPEAEMHVSLPESGLHWRRRVTRAEFEERAAPLIERTLDICRRALSDAGLEPAGVDEVVLVGGSTRVPAVRAAVERLFGRAPHTELNPDEVVALGAAVQAHVLTGGTRELLLMDVTPLSLGLETMGGAVAKLILRNSTIPCQASEGFTTYADDQTAIDFNVVQGERELAADCRSLGRFRLRGIPPMPAGMARVGVRFHIDANGLMTVSAKEESTGTAAHIDVQPLSGLSDGEVERMLKESIENAREDFDNSRRAGLRIEVDLRRRATEKGLAEHGDGLDPETRADVREALEAVAASAGSDDLVALQAARDGLERATLPLAARMMDSVARSALAGKTLDEV